MAARDSASCRDTGSIVFTFDAFRILGLIEIELVFIRNSTLSGFPKEGFDLLYGDHNG